MDSRAAAQQDKLIETSVLKDFLALIKIGIVQSNLITAFTGIWLALYFTGSSFLANLDLVFYGLVGTALTIAGSAVLNNYIDRDIDIFMKSKKMRPTVTGRIQPKTTLVMGLAFVFLGLIILSLASMEAAAFGLIGSFAYVVVYTMWSKRNYVSNTVVGSFSGAVPPLIGWATVDPGLHHVAWGLFLLMFIWQPPHFYALAMKRTEEYRAANIPMLPTVKGFKTTKIHMLVWVLFLLPLPFLLYDIGLPFVILSMALNLGWLYLSIKGFKRKDDLKWATQMFVYSLNYLTISFVSMVIITFIYRF